ncbi:MAG: sulfurtransferase [Winogradskyella sp.]|uniref:sulfurtransferase n=1 Tax=Winogradskyella sp. TaxID=1883156 RepID=UPI001790FA96|nr:sulfurtransferase [Winogradskyella sp.]MBT8245910.1 sulfurtransferase [Winogradskyella sp.]NNK23716.1 sulfurtransferase [Winogradskyella sp.]
MLQIETPLVSVDWLHKNIEAENLIVMDATIPKVSGLCFEKTQSYIPKSQFFDMKKKFSDTSAEFPNTIPSKSQFEAEAQQLGINNNSAIVVYDQHGIYSSARAWWLFRYFGHNNVAVLDGGLRQWIKKDFSTTDTYINQTVKGNFKATIHSELITNYEGIQALSKSKETLILDARSSKRFSGETPEPRKGLRSGTIPNSVNLPYTELFNGNTLKSKQELKSIFYKLVNHQDKLVFSCGSGITACNLVLAASVSGYKNITVYDGSWTEYGTLTHYAMDTPNWTKDELMAYILLYAAHSDFKEDNHERNVIISKVDMITFQKIHKEFSEDNDFQSIQKIITSVNAHNYSSQNIDQLLADIKGLFFADGNFDVKEHAMLLFLKRILK